MGVLKAFIDKQDLVTINPNKLVKDAVVLMKENHIGCILIVEGDSLKGLFTERDLVNRVVGRDLDPEKTHLSEVMTNEIDITTISTESKLEDCYNLMKTVGCRHLPIMDNGKLIGIVSARNILDWMMQELQKEKELLQQYIHT